ncbi:MAG: DUF3579 domain-containing protein [Gammaproteobacteria bacterium]|nr:DUF3579 domain-containing protein [Gammaproteobacteria bacterium]
MYTEQKDTLIVESVREDGRVFRPSDWVERISSQLATYGRDHRLHYSDHVHPCLIQGANCLVVKKSLQDENPKAYQFILKFAADNQLRVQDDRRSQSALVPTERRGTLS